MMMQKCVILMVELLLQSVCVLLEASRRGEIVLFVLSRCHIDPYILTIYIISAQTLLYGKLLSAVQCLQYLIYCHLCYYMRDSKIIIGLLTRLFYPSRNTTMLIVVSERENRALGWKLSLGSLIFEVPIKSSVFLSTFLYLVLSLPLQDRLNVLSLSLSFSHVIPTSCYLLCFFGLPFCTNFENSD